jgi:hypothetical protein
MKKSNEHQLVDGQFSPSEAINILYALFDSKIKFHQLESFRILEKNSGNVEHHEKRILELNKAYASVKDIIRNASNDNMNLEIHCGIEIFPVKRIN